MDQNSSTPISRFFRFIANIVKETVVWFFRGLGSCAASFVGFLFVVSALLFVLILLSGSSESPTTLSEEDVYKDLGGDSKIALIELSGIIVENATSDPLYGSLDSITPYGVEKLLSRVKSDGSYKGVVIHLSSPGGSPVASDRIYELIKDFKNETQMPVVISMGDIAASGGYYISAPADYIFANQATLTGSIGVILETYNLEGLYEKIGVRKETFKSGQYKDILSDSREITSEEREIINGLMTDTYDLFIERVAEGRHLSEAEVREVAEGRIYSGVSAREAKLVDELGSVDDAIKHVAKKTNISEYKVIRVKSSSLFDDLFSQIRLSTQGLGVNLGILDVSRPKYLILYKLP